MQAPREIEPYLFKFKRECLSPQRFVAGSKGDCEYDPVLQMSVTSVNGRRVPAIDSPTIQQRVTKKADIEKGEDQKDSYFWR